MTTRLTVPILFLCMCFAVGLVTFGQEAYLLWTQGTTDSSMTIPFLVGINLRTDSIEHDATVLALTPEDTGNITRILVPDVPNLFDFHDSDFYCSYEDGVKFVPEPSIVRMAVIDAANGGKSYNTITADDLDDISWELPEACIVTVNMTVVFETSDGHVMKVGKFENVQTEWATAVLYKKLAP